MVQTLDWWLLSVTFLIQRELCLQQRWKPLRTSSRWTESSSRHGLPTTAWPGDGRGVQSQLELSGAQLASVCERDAVDPPSAAGVCRQPVGVQQCDSGSGLHVLLPALHLPVRSTRPALPSAQLLVCVVLS